MNNPHLPIKEKMYKSQAEKSKKSSKKGASEENYDSPTKKPSMKTASDVISRLLWDESLHKDKFTVGYLDRFDGITEKPFSSLDWRDPAIVDNNTLALPKHRIQYFKYLNRKVWDKATRKDIVFGSTGYPQTIHEFIAMIDQDILNFKDEDNETILPSSNDTICKESLDGHSEDGYDTSERSNFFIAARITDENTVNNLKRVTDYIKSRDELLAQCCVNPEIYHLTLSILKLDSSKDISDAIDALKAVSKMDLSPAILELEGLDDFQRHVLYSRVEKNDDLMKMRNRLIDELVSRNVNITDRFQFVPHVTIAKLSRPVAKMRHSNFIDQYLYLKFEDDYFGKQLIDKLYLCEMGTARRDDGFYSCAFETSLNQKSI